MVELAIISMDHAPVHQAGLDLLVETGVKMVSTAKIVKKHARARITQRVTMSMDSVFANLDS